ncbi:uncharacterized protein [Bemisia tabaci]|uniref:uncharacterized protein n=1 Tax=Bemisia tabaci TaxID=7038 RepID=UPI003B280A2E
MLLFYLCYFQGYPFYKLNQERIEVVFQNATSLKVTYAEIHKINKTLTGLNFAVQIDDVSRANEYWLRLDGYERLGMEYIYKKSAFSYEMQFCRLLSGDILRFNKALNKFGYIMESCAAAKNDTYYVKDFFFDERTPLPPEVPGTHWRFDLKFYSKKDHGMVFMQYYVSVERKHLFSKPKT